MIKPKEVVASITGYALYMFCNYERRNTKALHCDAAEFGPWQGWLEKCKFQSLTVGVGRL